ncbi:hypothetical protein WDV85_15635 [Pseudokineococcus sp. 5B2Z-1]|uniref:hypothetical protein n=1 Tax=Pseudokineococcus sp. 5B2Z-1 TaxID=3132744 RepID=UPI00309C113D
MIGLVGGMYCLWGVFASNIAWTSSLEPPDYSTPSQLTFGIGAVLCAVVPSVVAALLHPSARRWLLAVAALLLVVVGGLAALLSQA